MAYRSELAALESATLGLEKELAEVSRELERVPNLEARRVQLLAELREAHEAANLLKAKEMLLGVEVARKCPADWSQMVGDARVRFCWECQKNVYNLSAMTAVEAKSLIEAREGICIRLYRRADGTVMTSDCPGPRSSGLLKRVALVVGAAGTALALANGLESSSSYKKTHVHAEDNPRLGQGKIVVRSEGSPSSQPRVEMGDLSPLPSPIDKTEWPDFDLPDESGFSGGFQADQDQPPTYWEAGPGSTKVRHSTHAPPGKPATAHDGNAVPRPSRGKGVK